MYRKPLFALAVLIVPALLFAQEVTPPTELPPTVAGALGILAPIIAQFVVNRVNGRFQRFLVAIGLTAATGLVSYAIVKPAGVDQVDFLVYFFAWAQISYQAVWRSLWDSSLPLPAFMKRVEGNKR